MVMGAVPLAMVGGLWLVYMLGFNLSVAIGVGFIALVGVAAEVGVIMLVYLDQAMKERQPTTIEELRETIIEGAVMGVRPMAMPAAVVIAGLLPIMLGSGTGSEVMQRIAAPMLGGMITAPLVSMVLIPVLYMFWRGRQIKVAAYGAARVRRPRQAAPARRPRQAVPAPGRPQPPGKREQDRGFGHDPDEGDNNPFT